MDKVKIIMKAFMVMPDIEDLNNTLFRKVLKEKSMIELRKFADLYGPKMNEDELNSILEKATEDITNRFEEVTSNGHIAEISSLNKIKIIGDGKGNLEHQLNAGSKQLIPYPARKPRLSKWFHL